MKQLLSTLILTTFCLLAAAPAQAQTLKTVMVNTNGVVQFPTNFWQTNADTNFQAFIGTNAFGQTNGFLQFVTRRHDVAYPQQTTWSPMPFANEGIAPEGRLWIANSDSTTNSNVSLVVFSNVSNLAQQTNITITNADAAHGGFRYDPTRNVMYASGRLKGGVYGINPTNYTFTNISTNAGAQHRPALIVGGFMYVSKGGAPSSESVSKINLTNDTEVGSVTVSPTNANTAAIYRMETNPAGTILAGAMTGLFGSNSAFWSINLSDFAATRTSATNVIFEVFAMNNTFAFVSGNPSGAYNLTNHAFTPMGELSYSGVLSTNGNVYFFGEGEIYQYNLNNSNRTTYFTGKSGSTDRLIGRAEIGGKIIATDGSTNVYELSFVPSVSSQSLTASNVSGARELPIIVQQSITNTYTLTNTVRDAYYELTPLNTNQAVLTTANMEGSYSYVGQVISIRNQSTNHSINVLRFNGSSITTIPPQQTRTWVALGGSGTFTNRWRQIFSREDMGLSATWLTNTNVTNFRAAIGLGTTNSVVFFTIDADAYEATGGLIGSNGISFEDDGQNITRTNLGLPLPALTNTSNVTMMRALAGSTNTNEPFSGTISFFDFNEDANTVTISNGIILNWQQ